MADYDAISKVIRNAIRKEVDKQIDAAYRRGYADGKARIEPTKAEKEQIYNHGLDAAWECAKKLVSLTPQRRAKILDCEEITVHEVFDFSASEAIAKIKEYEEKQAEKSCENCECFGDITECTKRPCYAHSCWTPKQAEIHCNATDKDIAGSFIEDVSAVKDQLPYYRNNKYYNTFPTSKETADEIKAEYDEETRSYTYTVDDDNDDITIDQAIYNIKRGYGIPHKHKTLKLAIKALKMMKEKRND